jgi:Ca2+-binding EF-hand superfamily protein
MRPQVFVAAFALALPLAAVPAAAQGDYPRGQQNSESSNNMRFRAMDRNHDGVITRREWRGSDESFRAHDWNGDGVLSGDEVRVGARREPNTNDDYTPASRSGFYDWTPNGFAKLDADRDGRITPEEWRYDYESFRRADRNGDEVLSRSEFVNADTDMDLEDRFDYLDANDDGRIDRSEWHSSVDAFRWLDRNRDGVLSRAEVVGNEAQQTPTDRFGSLDEDRNNRITPDEWQWSRRSFNQYDRNRDGVVTRDELEAGDNGLSPVGTSGSNASQALTVPSTMRWYDSGIDVRAGDTISYRADGTIRMSLGNDNDGASPAGSWSGRRAENAPIKDKPAGALIARIGNGSPVFLGASGELRAANTGRLYFGVNDDYLMDNSGDYRVTVNVRR